MREKILKTWKNIRHRKTVIFFDLLAWRIGNNRIQASSAQLAYFTLLSIFPFLIVLLNIVSRISLVYANVLEESIALFPPEVDNVIHAVLSDLRLGFGSNTQLLVSGFGTLYTASLGVKPMIKTCNLAYGYKEKKTGINLIFTSIVFTVAFIVLLILLFTTELLGDRAFRFIRDFFALPFIAVKTWYLIKNLAMPLYMMFLIFLINRYSLPRTVRKRIKVLQMIPGALSTTVLMIFLSSVFTIIIANSKKYAVTYGSISGVIIMIVWLYFMGASLVLGFEINGAVHDILTKPVTFFSKRSIINSLLERRL